jgi:hypothetical protein
MQKSETTRQFNHMEDILHMVLSRKIKGFGQNFTRQ